MVDVGAAAPPFEALDDRNRTVTLADFKGGWLVLYFYPKALTPG